MVRKILVAVAALLVPATAAAQRARGIDVSQFQGTMDWSVAHDAGARFAFVRATRGGQTAAAGRVDDTRFAQNMAAIADLAATGNVIHAGAYHFGRPDLVASGSTADLRASAHAEAAHFVEIAGPYMTSGHLRPVLDLEAGGPQLSRGGLTFWANSFLDEVERLAGVEPLVYMNTNYATNEIDDSLADRDLWIANWNRFSYGDPLTDGSPPVGRMDDWAFWQYSADGNGMGATFGAASDDIDLNVANGDLAFVQGFLIPEPATLTWLAAGGLLLRRTRGAAA